MAFSAQIPYGAYWSTPFAKWQGSLSHLHSMKFAAHVAKDELAKRDIDASGFDYGVMGLTVPQHQSFFGLPWLTGMIGADKVGGPTISQVCATGVRVLQNGVAEIECGLASTALVATCDRVSNSPQVYYPEPSGPGGTGPHENIALDNMMHDPMGGHSMTQTAENVAAKHQITTEQQHDVVLRRQQQYTDAVADGSAFLKRFMSLPFDVPSANFKKTVGQMEGDEGIFKSDKEKLAKLKPVIPDGSVTFGGQTHPADGNACIIVAEPDKAKELSQDAKIEISILGFGMARASLAHMPEAPVPAARAALDMAGLEIADIDAVKTHNPFAVNDVYFSRETGYDLDNMNNYGCTLVWGHPQAPMGIRAIIELIEELVIRGGGKGLFTGCAAGDSAMAVVISVNGN
ncbi:MAG: thiolase family protein [Rhodospirillales bacterium]|nr:acetyl-CoA acetyltransferase [Rhodospirillaceae bacterium]MDP6427356.1 thiolase family protein [Rhodospirillales bacterium]MDP6643643.1 thiolase family protein [Rhodospirillales bacterium]MDP6840246.1 thiolase family protein [Rhodospirillales bacterium]|tara:strand:+ start:2094 stop:3299 length:1206 start_codon:yes stop_codon:yes gene_type:complete